MQVIQRAVVHQRADRHVPDELSAVEHAHPLRVGDDADRRPAHLPLLAQVQHRVEARRLDHAQHALLGLRDHDLERLHPGLAQRHVGDVDVHPDRAFGGHLRGRGGQPGGTEVLQRDEQPPLEQLERALEELLLLERVAHLHGRAHVGARAPVGVVSPQLGRGEHRRPTDPVASGGGAEQHEQVPRPRRRGSHELLARGEPESHRVHQAVLLVGLLEVDLTADRGHADRVAVVPDAGHRTVQQIARARAGGLAEAKRVEHRDRPRPDGEDIPQNAPHAGGCSLEGLDRAGVVVGLDLERACQPAAHVDRPGVLARAHHHVRPLRGQGSQELLRVLVRAVLAPQQ